LKGNYLKKLGIGVGAIGGVIVLVVVVVVAYVFITAGSGEASVPISAPTLAVPTAAVPPAPSSESPAQADENAGGKTDEEMAEEAAAPDETMADEVMSEEENEDAEMAMEEEAADAAIEKEAAPDMEATEPPEPSATAVLFRIAPEESEVRFVVGEILDAEDNPVVGITDQVAGDILIDFDSPAASQLGQVRINVRTLRTDSSNRDRAIRSFVLESGSDANEFAEFDPIALVGLPDAVAVGDVVEFQIEGTLTLKGISAPVTFDVTLTIVSAERIEGTATGSVRHDAYDLRIPDARGRVTAVDDVVVLEIDFVAPAVTE
jgi:polyisoprenoid-binding protein YceI